MAALRERERAQERERVRERAHGEDEQRKAERPALGDGVLKALA